VTQPAAGRDQTLGDYAYLLRRRWLSVVAGVVAGLLVAVAYLSLATPTYVSTAHVLVNQTSTDTTATGARTTGSSVNLDTEAQIVKSIPVAVLAAKSLGAATTNTPAQLANHVSVTVPPNTTVLDISYSATTATAAQQAAQAFAKAYIANRSATAQASINQQVQQVQNVIDQLAKQRAAITEKLNSTSSPPSPTTRTALLARRDNLDTQLGATGVSLSTLLGTVVVGGTVIVNAPFPTSKTSPNPYLVLPSGLVVGLILGVALAVLREKSDRRVHRDADIERLFDLPVATSLDAGRTRNLGHSLEVQREMQVLYQTLVAPSPDTTVVTLLVGSDHRSADELAEVLSTISARSGSRTTLLRSQSLPDGARSAVGSPGLDLELLDYKSTGILVDESLRTHAVSAVITGLRARRDLVVLEMPTENLTADLMVLGHSVDVAIVVVELGRTTRKVVGDIVRDLGRTAVTSVIAVSVQSKKR
jgi:capsular polysaccharide biosynthesis protein